MDSAGISIFLTDEGFYDRRWQLDSFIYSGMHFFDPILRNDIAHAHDVVHHICVGLRLVRIAYE